MDVDSTSGNPFVAIGAPDSGTAFVAWHDGSSNEVNVTSYSVSSSGALTVGAGGTETVDSDAGSQGVAAVSAPDSSVVFVAWHDDTAGAIKVMAGSHSSGTITLSGTKTILDTSARVLSDVAVAAPDADNIYVAWYLDDLTDSTTLFEKVTAVGTTLTASGTQVTLDTYTGSVDGDVSITAPDANNVFVGFFDDEDSDTFKLAESANGLSLTIEPVDPHELGFVVITGTIVQTAD